MSDTMFRSPASINEQTNMVSYGDDTKLIVRFFRKPELHGLQSEEAGRPVYVGVDMCAIRQPGERDEWHGAASESHKMRFPRQWEAYQNGQEYIPDGTPLDVIFAAEPETVTNLKYFKIHTVEQLAALQENAISRIGLGGRLLVTKAQRFMEAATGYQAASKMNRDLEEQKSENELLKTRLEALEKLLATATEPEPKRGPGRPPNAKPETEQ